MTKVDPHSDSRHKVDPDVPYVWNDDRLNRFTKTSGRRNPSAHAYAMLHYRNLGCDAGAEGGVVCLSVSE